MRKQPIGVMDSGVGGLTVLKEIIKELPHEATVYIGDSHNAPYGKRTSEDIQQLATKLIQFLLKKDAKIIVIACNTITVNGIEKLRIQFPEVPIVGTVPVVKSAARVTKNKKIGVLATETTAKSPYNKRLIHDFAADCEVVTIGTNNLVPLIETDNRRLLPGTVAKELARFKRKGVDVVVLGCTHFPILRPQIRHFLGKEVALLDSGGAVARQVRRVLMANNALSEKPHKSHVFFTTGVKDPFAFMVKRVLKKEFPARKVVIQ